MQKKPRKLLQPLKLGSYAIASHDCCNFSIYFQSSMTAHYSFLVILMEVITQEDIYTTITAEKDTWKGWKQKIQS